MTRSSHKHHSSFRDPSGFLFTQDNVLYRQINRTYKNDYDHYIHSGLYKELDKNHKIIKHQEVDIQFADQENGYCVIKPQYLPFISYPYEWSFSQLKDSALLTLDIQNIALDYGMSLKDASAYNVQFLGSKPIFIDTLSFEIYHEGSPWIAYRQFCQHFLAPLALMAYRDIRLISLLKNYIDGIPLDLAVKLLPFSSRLNFGLIPHIFMHAKAQKQYADRSINIHQKQHHFSQTAFRGLIESLKGTVSGLKWEPGDTEWIDYYDITNYSHDAFETKKQYVKEFIASVNPSTIWDLGANTGEFSQISSNIGANVIAFDIDAGAVEKHFISCKNQQISNILPLCLDLCNPSPAIGWHNHERMSFIERAPADMVLALALIHHLAISNNVPLSELASFFSNTSKWLVIEFIPKSDSQTQKLLQNRIDIFHDYDQSHFENEMLVYFDIKVKQPIAGSQRTLYLMEQRSKS